MEDLKMFDTKEQMEQLKEEIEVEKMRKELLILKKENSELASSATLPSNNSLMYKIGKDIGNSLKQSEIQFESIQQEKSTQISKTYFSELKYDMEINICPKNFDRTLIKILNEVGVEVHSEMQQLSASRQKNTFSQVKFINLSKQEIASIINNFRGFNFNVKYQPKTHFSCSEICGWVKVKPNTLIIKRVYPNFDEFHKVLVKGKPFYEINKSDFLSKRSVFIENEDYSITTSNRGGLKTGKTNAKILEQYCNKLGENWHLIKDIQEILGVSLYRARKFIIWLNLADDLIKHYDGKNAGILKNTKFYHIEKDSMQGLFDKYEKKTSQSPYNEIHGVSFSSLTNSDSNLCDIYSHEFVWKLVSGKVLENTYLKEGQLDDLSEIKDDHIFGKSLQFIESTNGGNYQKLVLIKMSALDPSCIKKIQEFVKKS